NALPVRRWQARQWQTETRTGSPSVHSRSCPQLHEASRVATARSYETDAVSAVAANDVSDPEALGLVLPTRSRRSTRGGRDVEMRLTRLSVLATAALLLAAPCGWAATEPSSAEPYASDQGSDFSPDPSVTTPPAIGNDTGWPDEQQAPTFLEFGVG